MVGTVKIEGLAELDNALGELPKTLARGAMRRSLKKAGEPVATLAASLAPRDTGNLHRSIVTTTQLTKRHRRGAKQNEVEMHIGPAAGGRTLYYATWAEYGTVDTPARPFMRPAWAALQQTVLVNIGKYLGAEVEKAAARHAKKLAKG